MMPLLPVRQPGNNMTKTAPFDDQADDYDEWLTLRQYVR